MQDDESIDDIFARMGIAPLQTSGSQVGNARGSVHPVDRVLKRSQAKGMFAHAARNEAGEVRGLGSFVADAIPFGVGATRQVSDLKRLYNSAEAYTDNRATQEQVDMLEEYADFHAKRDTLESDTGRVMSGSVQMLPGLFTGTKIVSYAGKKVAATAAGATLKAALKKMAASGVAAKAYVVAGGVAATGAVGVLGNEALALPALFMGGETTVTKNAFQQDIANRMGITLDEGKQVWTHISSRVPELMRYLPKAFIGEAIEFGTESLGGVMHGVGKLSPKGAAVSALGKLYERMAKRVGNSETAKRWASGVGIDSLASEFAEEGLGALTRDAIAAFTDNDALADSGNLEELFKPSNLASMALGIGGMNLAARGAINVTAQGTEKLNATLDERRKAKDAKLGTSTPAEGLSGSPEAKTTDSTAEAAPGPKPSVGLTWTPEQRDIDIETARKSNNDDTLARLSPEAEAEIDELDGRAGAMRRSAELNGVAVEFVRSEKGQEELAEGEDTPNVGWFIGPGRMIIDIDAVQAQGVLFHEIVHNLEAVDKAAFDALYQVMQRIDPDGMKAVEALQKKRGGELNAGEFAAVRAEQVATILARLDTDAGKLAIARLVENEADLSTFKKFIERFKDMLRKLSPGVFGQLDTAKKRVADVEALIGGKFTGTDIELAQALHAALKKMRTVFDASDKAVTKRDAKDTTEAAISKARADLKPKKAEPAPKVTVEPKVEPVAKPEPKETRSEQNKRKAAAKRSASAKKGAATRKANAARKEAEAEASKLKATPVTKKELEVTRKAFQGDKKDGPNEDTRAKIERDPEAAAATAVERMRGHTSSVLGNAISKDFKDRGTTSLIGQKVETAEDLAALSQVFRNPAFETFRVFFAKDGVVVGQTGVTSRMPAITSAVPGRRGRKHELAQEYEDNAKYKRDMIGQGQALEADEFWLLHNHPSGRPDPSGADFGLTDQFNFLSDGMGAKFGGHVVIDHGSYTVIHPNSRKVTHGRVDVSGPAYGEPTVPHAILGRRVTRTDHLAGLATELHDKDGYFHVIGLDAGGFVSGIAEVPLDAVYLDPATAIAHMRAFAKQTGSAAMFATNVQADHLDFFIRAIKTGLVGDAVSTTGTSLRTIHPHLEPGDEFLTGSTAQVSRRVVPDAKPKKKAARKKAAKKKPRFAKASPIKSPAFKRWFGDSKVVDADGKPLVVYHGAPDMRGIWAGGFKALSRGDVWFATDKTEVADSYADDRRAFDYQKAEPGIVPLYLSMQNPLVVNAKGKQWKDTEAHIEEAQAGGHDGLIIHNSVDFYNNAPGESRTSTVYAVFKPTQAKSAATAPIFSRIDGKEIEGAGPNKGTFDAKDPDIRHARGKRTRKVDRLKQQDLLENIPLTEMGKLSEINRRFLDRLNRLDHVEDLMREANPDLPDDFAFATVARLSYGKIEARTAAVKRKYEDKIVELVKDGKLDWDDINQYVYRRHVKEGNEALEERALATERKLQEADFAMQEGNKALAKELRRWVDKFGVDMGATVGEETERAEKLWREYEAEHPVAREVADLVRDMNNEAREMLARDGLISRDEADLWASMYSRYVPTKTKQDEHGDFAKPAGFSTPGADVYARKGRTSIPDNVITMSFNQVYAGIRRGEINQVGKSFYKAIDAMGMVATIEEWTEAHDGKQLPEEALVLKFDGVDHIIVLKDKDLARAMKALTPKVMVDWMRPIQKAMRFLSGLITQFSPEFIFTNLPRDIQTALINTADSGQKGVAGRVLGNVPSVMKAAWRHERGQAPKNEFDKWVGMFVEDGGQTGWAHAYTFDQRDTDLQKRINRGAAMGKLHEGLDIISDANSAFEMATRVSVYKALVEGGMSRQKAARYAREVTVDFNRSGEYGPVLNTMYMFLNAGLQGNARMVRAFVQSSKVRKVALGMVAAGAMQDMLMRALSEEDDDGKKVYDNIPEYVKDHNWIFMNPFGDGYLRMPMPYGWNLPVILGRRAVELSRGDITEGEFVGGLLKSVLENFSPIQGPSLSLAIVPSLARPLFEVAQNRNFAGIPIANELYPNQVTPASGNARESTLGMWSGIAQAFNAATGGDEFTPGAMDIAPEGYRHIMRSYTGSVGKFIDMLGSLPINLAQGKDIPANEIPIIRRFYGERNPYGTRSAYYDIKEDLSRSKKRLDVYKSRGDMEDFREWRKRDKGLLSMETRMKASDKILRALRKRRSAASGHAEKQVITDRMDAVMATFRREANKRILTP